MSLDINHILLKLTSPSSKDDALRLTSTFWICIFVPQRCANKTILRRLHLLLVHKVTTHTYADYYAMHNLYLLYVKSKATL
jgi:hypothetical protein